MKGQSAVQTLNPTEGQDLVPPEDAALVLRRPVAEDLSFLSAYSPSADIARMAGYSGTTDWDPRLEGLRLFDRIKASPYGWLAELNGRLVGHVRLSETEMSQRRGRLVTGLFEGANLGRGYGRRAVALALDHLFPSEGFHRIDLRVLAYNRRAIRCYLACGFSFEGLEREVFNLEGVWHGDWMMSILEHEPRLMPHSADRLFA